MVSEKYSFRHLGFNHGMGKGFNEAVGCLLSWCVHITHPLKRDNGCKQEVCPFSIFVSEHYWQPLIWACVKIALTGVPSKKQWTWTIDGKKQ